MATNTRSQGIHGQDCLLVDSARELGIRDAQGASSLAAVWARETTRDAIFNAMEKKEVYATSGSRILVRIFAGWNFEADDVERPDFADHGSHYGIFLKLYGL